MDNGKFNRTHLIDPNKLLRTELMMMIPKGKKRKCFNYTNAVEFSLRFFGRAAALKSFFRLSDQARNKSSYPEDVIAEADATSWARGNVIGVIESKTDQADFQCQSDGGRLPRVKNKKELIDIARVAKTQGITFQPLNLDRRGGDLIDSQGMIRVDSLSTASPPSMLDVPGIDVNNLNIILKPIAEAGTEQKTLCLIPRATVRESIVHHTHFIDRWDMMYKIMEKIAKIGKEIGEDYSSLKATTRTGP